MADGCAETVRAHGHVGDDGRVLVAPAHDGWVRLVHQDHGSYYVPHYEARSLALRLLRAADLAERLAGFAAYEDAMSAHIDGSQDAPA